jgi:hypothetical protein
VIRRITVLLPLLMLAVVPGAPLQSSEEPPRVSPAFSCKWGPAGLEVRFRDLDPAVLARLAGRKPSREEWVSLCAVKAFFGAGNIPRDLPPLLGSYEARGNVVAFRPKYPIREDVAPRLRCTLDASLYGGAATIPSGWFDPDLPGKVRIDIDLRSDSRRTSPAPTLRRIYPSAEVLPENLLRFYLHFSAPMSRGEAYRHIRLLDASEKAISDPFLELDEELWSTDGRRFTLLFDPGRIKRGLKPREEVGPILERGKSYTLVVDQGWPSAAGVPLEGAVRRSFRVGPPDETCPDPGTWKICTPAAGTLVPLTLKFPEPLDHALALRLISVRDPSGQLVSGESSIEEQETLWSVTPREQKWKPGEYRLEIGTELEDVAGNSIARPFEVDLVEPISSRAKPATVSVPIRVGNLPGR